MDFGLDVRPTLSRPTGVGTYVLGLAEALPLLAPDDRFHYFSASIKERYPARSWPPNVRLVDRRLPVRGLNAAWNRLAWPTLDRLVRPADHHAVTDREAPDAAAHSHVDVVEALRPALRVARAAAAPHGCSPTSRRARRTVERAR
mgnify:CR=1 FL=1